MKIKPKTALLSVSNKKGLVPFAKFLAKQNIKLIATGGTAKTLRVAGVGVSSISSLTGFPEIFGGRVKSMHPKIAGGILGQRDSDKEEAKKNKISSLLPLVEPQKLFGSRGLGFLLYLP